MFVQPFMKILHMFDWININLLTLKKIITKVMRVNLICNRCAQTSKSKWRNLWTLYYSKLFLNYSNLSRVWTSLRGQINNSVGLGTAQSTLTSAAVTARALQTAVYTLVREIITFSEDITSRVLKNTIGWTHVERTWTSHIYTINSYFSSCCCPSSLLLTMLMVHL